MKKALGGRKLGGNQIQELVFKKRARRERERERGSYKEERERRELDYLFPLL